ncbi:MAG: hypothetical protein WD278_20315 [Pirellulales bacterium]
MTKDARRMPQFSLRALLLLVSASAVLLASWRAFGLTAAISILMAVLLAIPIAATKPSWKRAYLLSCLTMYGPFIAMATYTLLHVSCSHCKAAAWMVLPCGPGLVPVELARGWLDLPRPSDTVWFAAALFVSGAMVIVLAWLIRRRRWWWRALSAAAAMTYGTFAAIGILAAIRA